MRIEYLKKELERKGLGGYFTTDVRHIYYLTHFMDISEAILNLIIPLEGEVTLLTTPLSFAPAKELAKNCIVKKVSKEEMGTRIIDEIKLLQTKHIAFDKLPIQTYLKLLSKLEEVKLVHRPNIVFNLRKIKDGGEIECLRKAAKLADVGFEAGMKAVKPGVREFEVAAEIEYAMRIHGSEGTAFETIVASGPRSANPHGRCSNRVLREGDLVIMDFGGVYAGYRSDLTRTTVVGACSSKQSQMLELVLKAQEEAFQGLRAGITAKEADAIARNILANEGWGKNFLHGLGHGVGLDIHELPTLSPNSNDILEEGEVVTVEPGIYIEGFGGVRIEDTVLIRRNCGEKLTKASYHTSHIEH